MSSHDFPNDEYADDFWDTEAGHDSAQELYQDETFERFRMLAEIGTHADELMSRLKNDRAPDHAKTTFIFNRGQLDRVMPRTPRYVDVLTADQYKLDELSVTFRRDFRKDTHGIEVTFGLKDTWNPDEELHTLVANRDDLRSPKNPAADTFTIPSGIYGPNEDAFAFPTLSSSDLRQLIASLLPLSDQHEYAMHDDWVQLPGNFEALVQNIAKQDVTHVEETSYNLHDAIGTELGSFTCHMFDGSLLSFEIKANGDLADTHYEVSLGLLPPPEDKTSEEDAFFGNEPVHRTVNNDESPVMVHVKNHRTGKRGIPQAGSLEDLYAIDHILQNKPGIHEDPTIETLDEEIDDDITSPNDDY